ncbi:hypothetical protein [Acinetobacter sp. YH12219]|uniref:hypothetical protein n=1 Tax=Acinetobacter sp. YH12219 TaxID=2601153 RepID=UPI0015D204DA|nr:hypothetical protein [Acinetobacter sp. YH12219]
MDEKNAHNLVLGFSKKLEQKDSHNLVLKFGESGISKDVTAFFAVSIPSPLLSITADIFQTGNALVHISVNIPQPVFEITAESTAIPPANAVLAAEVSAPVLSVDAKYTLSSVSEFYAEIAAPLLSFTADYDFNVLRYTTAGISTDYQFTNPVAGLTYAAHQASNFYKDQFGLNHQLAQKLDAAGGDVYQNVAQFKDQINFKCEQTGAAQVTSGDAYQSNMLRRNSSKQIWQETDAHTLVAADRYDYNVAKSRSNLSWWQQAIQKGITCGFGFNASVWLQVIERLRYQQTVSPKTGAWVEPPAPELNSDYAGSSELHFCCKKAAVDPLNVVLNFTHERCKPGQPEQLDNKKVYFIMNEGYLKRVSDGASIEVKSLNLSIDRDSWCWSFSASLPFTEELKVNTDDEYIEVELGLNGFIWRFLIESNTSNQQFASTDIQIKGRSVTAMLAEEAGTRSYNQTIAASSVQLAQAELQRITLDSPFSLQWSLVDELGWNVPANAWSYAELTPIKAIQEIAEGAGGFVSSHMKDRKLLIQPRYAYAPWEWAGLTPDVSIPFNLVLQRTREKDFKPNYNAVTVAAEHQGIQAIVKREGTAGDKMAPTAVTPFINSEQPARTMARAELSKYGKKRIYQDTIPLHPNIGVILPSQIISMQDRDLGTWNGHSYGTSISASWSSDAGLKIRQTFTVERYIA